MSSSTLEKEFLKLAGFSLLSRWQLLGNETEDWKGKSCGSDKPLFYLQMSLMGYQDACCEMRLILPELIEALVVEGKLCPCWRGRARTSKVPFLADA